MAEVKEEVKNTTTTVKTTSKTVNEPTFSKQQFLDNAEALGYSKPILIGAFFNVKKESFTKIEVKKLVEEFLEKEAK